jgi:hypothetical protein
MPAAVLLTDIVNELEMQFDEQPSFLDLDTGQVETVSRELLRNAEEAEDGDPEASLPAWQKDQWEIAKRIVSTDRFVPLPSKFDVDDWDIMHDFARSIRSEKIRADLLDAVHGAGAFRHFKHMLRIHRLKPRWHEFRTEALKQIAIEWCKEKDIAWRS